MKPLVIQSSELAACIGRNQYQSRPDMLLKYMKANFPHAYAEHSKKTGQKTRDDQAKEVKRRIGEENSQALKQMCLEVHKAVKDASSSSNVTYSEGIQSAVASVNASIAKVQLLNDDEKKILADDMKKSMYTRVGTQRETFVASSLQNAVFERGYHKRFWTYAYTPEGEQVEIMIGGKVDAFQVDPETGEKSVVEIKNRMNRLFNRLVDYEYVQVMAYMYIHNLTNAKLVERYQDQEKTHVLEWNDDEWQTITRDAIAFAQNLFATVCEAESDKSDS